MAKRVLAFLSAVILWAPLAYGQADKAGSKDVPGVPRMPGFFIYNYIEAQFDGQAFPVMKDGKRANERVEGHLVKLTYHLTTAAKAQPPASALQIVRNYQNAVKTAGGEVLDDHPGSGWHDTTLRLAKDGKETWILIQARPGEYQLFVAERQAMQQDLSLDAAAMAAGLGAKGSVALYGIYFDTGKADVKPESDAALQEVAKMLTANPAMQVFVVGHTDMVGDAASNLKLSQARAEAVVAALVSRYKVAAARLIPFGNGPYAPVATNKTDEGRAKNRRVELVEIATK